MDAFEIAAIKTARRREIELQARALADVALNPATSPADLKARLDVIAAQLQKLTALP